MVAIFGGLVLLVLLVSAGYFVRYKVFAEQVPHKGQNAKPKTADQKEKDKEKS